MTVPKRLCLGALAYGLAQSLLPFVAHAQETQAATSRTIEQRLDELKAAREDLVRTIRDFDARIDALEAEVKGQPPASAIANPIEATPLPPPAVAITPPQPAAVAVTPPPNNPPLSLAVAPTPSVVPVSLAVQYSPPDGSIDFGSWGAYAPGSGFTFVRTKNGEISLSLISYLRYLNQLGLDPTYTDSFGRTKTLDLRQDFLLNKVNITFKGWLFDPDFTFRAWIWTQNPAMGLGAQVVVAGQLGYHFSDYLNLYGGVSPLPSNRTTNWTYPNWLKMDNRTIADEFFRASYSFGIWADGKITDKVLYRAMIANNLSALGVDAAQLDNEFNTLSGAIWWMPTTGEYGPGEGFGDYEFHENFATRFGVHYTRSREDAQSQPNEDDFENSQIRLSDGTRIFEPGAFATDGRINRATYQMVAANAGFKYRGASLEGEFYWRWIDDLETEGFIPVTHLFDTGFQLQGSVMLVPDRFQLYSTASKVFGEYGDPWDLSVGFNWFPFSRKEIRVNMQGIYLRRSPVGGTSYPYIVGGNGWLFNTDFIVTF